jgi:WD40 repeat protein
MAHDVFISYSNKDKPISDVFSVSLSADGRYAVSGCVDKTLKLWEVDLELEEIPPLASKLSDSKDKKSWLSTLFGK